MSVVNISDKPSKQIVRDRRHHAKNADTVADYHGRGNPALLNERLKAKRAG